MDYKVVYTQEAEQDLINIYNYISLELKVPVTARKQADRIMDFIRSLEKIPLRHKLYPDEPWYSRELRFCPVDNYLIFYFCSCRVAVKYISCQLLAKRFCYLTAAGVMHAHECDFWSIAHDIIYPPPPASVRQVLHNVQPHRVPSCMMPEAAYPVLHRLSFLHPIQVQLHNVRMDL